MNARDKVAEFFNKNSSYFFPRREMKVYVDDETAEISVAISKEYNDMTHYVAKFEFCGNDPAMLEQFLSRMQHDLMFAMRVDHAEKMRDELSTFIKDQHAIGIVMAQCAGLLDTERAKKLLIQRGFKRDAKLEALFLSGKV